MLNVVVGTPTFDFAKPNVGIFNLSCCSSSCCDRVSADKGEKERAMKVTGFIPAIAVVMLAYMPPTHAQADIVEDIARGNYDMVEYNGTEFTVVRIDQKDGTELVEFRHPGNGTRAHLFSVARFPKGLAKGLAGHLVADTQYEMTFNYNFDSRGKIESKIEIHSPYVTTGVTARLEACVGDAQSGCFTLDWEEALFNISTFTRANNGTLWSGVSTSTWFVENGKSVLKEQHIRFDRTERTERLIFEGWNQPWAYPAAGYVLEKLTGGKKILRVCASFANDTCKTARD